MSEVENHALSVLLPEARVAVFCTDSQTLESARKAQDDWRFARVKLAVEEGDINSATTFYADQPSPDLIIVQTETIDESLTEKLETLAAQCEEHTAAIVIGPLNDVYLYRQMIEMGVSDYLVKPIKPDVMADMMAKTLINRIGITESRLIAVIGAKGGVGVSSIAQGLASGVADILHEKTLLMDLAGGWSTQAVSFGFEPATTLSDLISAAEAKDEDALERALLSINNDLSILSCGADAMLDNPLQSEHFERLIQKALAKYPVTIADLSQATPEISRTILAQANQVLVIASPFLPALRLSRSLVQEIKTLRGGKEEGIDLLMNMRGLNKGEEVSTKDIEAAIEMKIATSIPFNGSVFMGAEAQAQPLITRPQGRAIIAQHILPVIAKTIDADLPDTQDKSASGMNLFGGFVQKLKSH